MIKEYEHIRFLLNKYWNCETSLEEEKKLRDFFSGEDIPEDLQPYAPLFRYCKESRNSIRLGNDFDKKLETAIRQKEKEKQYITIRIFAPALKIAASIAIIITLGVGIYFLVNENRKPYFARNLQRSRCRIQRCYVCLGKTFRSTSKRRRSLDKDIG